MKAMRASSELGEVLERARWSDGAKSELYASLRRRSVRTDGRTNLLIEMREHVPPSTRSEGVGGRVVGLDLCSFVESGKKRKKQKKKCNLSDESYLEKM